jgi:hypothetical protein
MQAETVLPKMKLQSKQPGKTHSGTTDPNIQAQNRQTGNACAEQQTHKPTQNNNSSTMAVANATHHSQCAKPTAQPVPRCLPENKRVENTTGNAKRCLRKANLKDVHNCVSLLGASASFTVPIVHRIGPELRFARAS